MCILFACHMCVSSHAWFLCLRAYSSRRFLVFLLCFRDPLSRGGCFPTWAGGTQACGDQLSLLPQLCPLLHSTFHRFIPRPHDSVQYMILEQTQIESYMYMYTIHFLFHCLSHTSHYSTDTQTHSLIYMNLLHKCNILYMYIASFPGSSL